MFEATGYGETAVQDVAICKAVGEELMQLYPRHRWAIQADTFAGVVDIRLMYANHDPAANGFGYLLKLSTLMSGESAARRAIMRAGGELLERYGLARGAANEQSALRAKEHGLTLDGARK
jgi:hypothetical protein